MFHLFYWEPWTYWFTLFDFKSHHSTKLALNTASEQIRQTIDAGGSAGLILLDLSAAFDTVNHNILSDCLASIKIKDLALTLLKSFLMNREQFVALDVFNLPTFLLPCGAPQGSSLSPTLFNVYVTPLAKLINYFGFSVVSYADDTQIGITVAPDPDETATRFHDCLIQVEKWMSLNWLKLNSSKTEVSLFDQDISFWSPTWWPH